MIPSIHCHVTLDFEWGRTVLGNVSQQSQYSIDGTHINISAAHMVDPEYISVKGNAALNFQVNLWAATFNIFDSQATPKGKNCLCAKPAEVAAAVATAGSQMRNLSDPEH